MGAEDQICQMDTVTTASGSHAYADFVPDEDDVVVERIRAAGAVVIGKTQVPEFGYSGTGQSRPAIRGTLTAPPAAHPRDPVSRSRRALGRSRLAATAAVRSGSPPASAGSTASSPR
jgi:aspartyl-tRNA(Asn)/glutamyl-tRNA(Gln) amidotransferase subunit A